MYISGCNLKLFGEENVSGVWEEHVVVIVKEVSDWDEMVDTVEERSV